MMGQTALRLSRKILISLLLIAAPLLAQSNGNMLFMAPAASGGGGGTVSFEATSASPGTGTFNTSVSTSITLGGASSTRAVMVGLALNVVSTSGITVTVGGQSATLVAGTDTGSSNADVRTLIFCVPTALTGAQTVLATWTGSSAAVIGAISATGVDQGIPCNNGNFIFTTNPSTTDSLMVSSNNGDLTSTVVGVTVLNDPSTNQTSEWSATATSNIFSSQDIGPGTGATTHTWSNGSGLNILALSGANFKHA